MAAIPGEIGVLAYWGRYFYFRANDNWGSGSRAQSVK